MLLAFLALVLLALAGCAGLVRLARGKELLPPRRATRRVRRVSAANAKLLSIALLVGVVVAVLTRWPVAAVMAAAVVFLWPKISGAGSTERAGVAKVEAIAAWTESLRDTAAAASGLEYAIPATLEGAPKLLERPLRNLVHRLGARVPLPEALTLFADEVDDPGADMVVAALSLNARQRAGSLSRVLTSLAASTRAELEVRRKVLNERNSLRRQSQQVAGLLLAFAAGTVVLAPGWVAPYGTPVGQLILAVIAAAYLALMMRLRTLAAPERQPRFLGDADAVTEMASYKPRVVGG
jgi:tight adherence protein B